MLKHVSGQVALFALQVLFSSSEIQHCFKTDTTPEQDWMPDEVHIYAVITGLLESKGPWGRLCAEVLLGCLPVSRQLSFIIKGEVFCTVLVQRL